MNFCGVDHKQISAVIDKNPLKHRMLTPGSKIPIISNEKCFRHLKQQKLILLLAWNFQDEVIEDLKKEFQQLSRDIQYRDPKVRSYYFGNVIGKSQKINEDLHAGISCSLLKKGLYQSIQVKNLTTQPEAWGGTLGMTWMIGYFAALIPVWIYLILRTV